MPTIIFTIKNFPEILIASKTKLTYDNKLKGFFQILGLKLLKFPVKCLFEFDENSVKSTKSIVVTNQKDSNVEKINSFVEDFQPGKHEILIKKINFFNKFF